jgi:hypothetical protein
MYDISSLSARRGTSSHSIHPERTLNAFLDRPLVFQASIFITIKMISTGVKSLIRKIIKEIMVGRKLG